MQFIELLKILILGIVQGITEWLPISSTGHMILVDEIIKLNVTPEFMKMFLVVIQFGSILAVVTLFFHKLNPFSPKKTTEEKSSTWTLWFKVAVACIPVMILMPLDSKIEELFYENSIVVAITLIFYGILFIIIENRNKNKESKIKELKDLTYKTALMIGIFQMLAVIPGTSRSGATIIGAILIGTSRVVAAEFTFFLAIPVMFGASLLKIVKFGFAFTSIEILTLIIASLTAYLVSILAIKFLLKYIKKNDFKVFGYYRIVLGIIVLLYFLI